MKAKLTSRQRVFAESYALRGGASRAAVLAGCNPKSAPVRANRWLKNQEIRKYVEEVRAKGVKSLQNELRLRVLALFEAGLKSPSREGRRACSFAAKLGLFQHRDSYEREICEVEAKFGYPFETIVDVLCAAGLVAALNEGREQEAFEDLRDDVQQDSSSNREKEKVAS